MSMPWSGFQYVTSGLTLAAFVAVVVLQIYRQRLKTWEKTLELAEPGERTNLALGALESFHVDTNRLTKDQAYRIAMETIKQRAQRHSRYAILVALFGVLTFSYLALSLLRGGGKHEATTQSPRYVAPESVRLSQHQSAQAAYDIAYKKLQAGVVTFSYVITAHEKLIQTDVELSSTRQERIEVYRKALDAAKHLEEDAKKNIEIGALAPGDLHEVHRHRLETEILLAKEESGTSPEDIRLQQKAQAEQAYADSTAKFDAGNNTVADFIRAHDKLIEAEAGLCNTHAERAEVYRIGLAEAKRIETNIAGLIKAGAIPSGELPSATHHRIEIEVLLAKEQSATPRQ